MPLWTHNGEIWQTVNLHKKINGLSAFLCCGGPSLNTVNPCLLKGPNRLVLGMNNTYPFIVPDMWTGLDQAECYDSRLFWEQFPKIMRGSYGKEKLRGFEVNKLNCVYFADIDVKEKASDYFDFSENTVFRYDKNTFAFAIQFLLWLGIKNIYFFGVDLNNSTEHYFDGSYLTNKQKGYNAKLYDEIFVSLKQLTKECKERGINFVSCSPGSRIHEFMKYEDYLDVIKMLEIDVPSGREKKHVLEGEEEG